jgi:SRSO17 transposase
VRTEPWLQAGKYVAAVASGMAKRNGWTIAEQAGDRTPQRTQRLLNRAAWDAFAAMGVVRRFAVAGLDEAARRGGQRPGLAVGVLDETSQVKQGTATAGVKRHYLGCAGKVANGITMVCLAYARERTGHALIGARQWIPAEHISDPVTSLITGLPLDLEFRTKGQLAIDILTEALADGAGLDFVCGDEVYGTCTELREFLEDRGQGYVLRVPSSFRLTLAAGVRLTCAQAVTRLLAGARRWEVRSAGTGSKGARWYAWAWLGIASPRHHLLVRRHLGSGELAFHLCHVPAGQPASKSRLIRAAGLRWPVEETFEFGKGCFGLDQSQVRLYAAIARPTALVMAALAAPPPSPLTLVPPAHPVRPQHRNCPGQLANGGCRTSCANCRQTDGWSLPGPPRTYDSASRARCHSRPARTANKEVKIESVTSVSHSATPLPLSGSTLVTASIQSCQRSVMTVMAPVTNARADFSQNRRRNPSWSLATRYGGIARWLIMMHGLNLGVVWYWVR